MAFVLFILVNAVLYTRPMEVVPELQDVQVYNYLIVACLVCAVPGVLEQFMGGALYARPVTVCILGLQAAAVLSHLANLNFEKAYDWGYVFGTILVYYLLAVATLDTPARLRQFLFWLTLSMLVLAVLALLQYHGLISFNKVKTTINERMGSQAEGTDYVVARLVGPGVVFADPNDICAVFIVGVLLSLYWLSDARLGFLRLFWLGPLAVFVYAMAMTYSRGGFLGLLAGLLVFAQARYGWKKALLIGSLALPVLLVAFAGRATELSTQEGTAQQRIQIWSDSLAVFRSAPVFGVGMGEFGGQGDEYVAHNSFLHCYAELGLLGGTLFVGAFFVAFLQLRALGRPGVVRDAELRRLRPFLLAMLAAYSVAILSLSRQFVPSTYTLLGLATAYARVATPPLRAPVLPLDARLVQRLVAASVGFLAVTYVFVRLLIHRV